MPGSPYTSQNFDPSQEMTRNSARMVVPLVLDMIDVNSVCDVGCSSGTWLSVFAEHGVENVFGIDDRAEPENLEIPRERYLATDLSKRVTLDRRFDLAVCLEVAEHLPRERARDLIADLVDLAPAVLFSAAIPQQGGAGHVNEQWPEYWESHFGRSGYVAVDCIRPKIWRETQIHFWYAQNTLLFVNEALLDSAPRLRRDYEASKGRPLSIVHPRMLRRVERRSWMELKELTEARHDGLLSEEDLQAKIARRIWPDRDPSAARIEGEGTEAELGEQGFEARLQALDPALFEYVPSETTRQDRISLLALHRACREVYGTFRYIEIGSHLGGTLQALVADGRCTGIVSIDPRPLTLPDARGRDLTYPGNSTERMLAYLRRVPGADLAKLETVEASTQDISAADFEGTAQLCFIDAEHMHEAALRDARFCRRVLRDDGAIAFHDRRLVSSAIEDFVAELDPNSFSAYALQGSVFVVELGPPRLIQTDSVARLVHKEGEEFVPPPTRS